MAQASVFPRVVAELTEGHKRSHWMWFIFPQVAGLGFSAMAQRFAIYSRAEAEAYLAHRVLEPRLLECTRLVLAVKNRTIHDIFGSPDDMKFRSSMTLFGAVSANPIFAQAISTHCGGKPDRATLDRLKAMDSERPPADGADLTFAHRRIALRMVADCFSQAAWREVHREEIIRTMA